MQHQRRHWYQQCSGVSMSWQDGQSPGIPECTGAQFVAGETLRDLVTLTFDLLTLTSSYIAGHVINTAKKLEDPMPVRS